MLQTPFAWGTKIERQNKPLPIEEDLLEAIDNPDDVLRLSPIRVNPAAKVPSALKAPKTTPFPVTSTPKQSFPFDQFGPRANFPPPSFNRPVYPSQNKSRPAPSAPIYDEIKLPQLEMPHFEGDIKKWPVFWQMFESSVDCKPIAPIKKMIYLINYLKGPAAHIAEGFIPSNDNYQTLVDLLKTRYGKPRVLIEQLQADLINLPNPNNAIGSLRKFSEDLEKICRQLGNSINTEENRFLSTTLKMKLPASTLKKIIEDEKKSGDSWTAEDIRKALNDIIDTMEEVQRCTQTLRNDEQKPKANHQLLKKPFKGHKENEVSRSFLTKQAKTKESCSLCNSDDHSPSNCTKYSTPKARFERLKEQERCLNCLKKGHKVQECYSKRKCSHCGGKHNFIVCFKSEQKIGLNKGNDPTNQNKGKSSFPKPNKRYTIPGKSQSFPAKGTQSHIAHVAEKETIEENNQETDTKKVQFQATLSALSTEPKEAKREAFLMTRKCLITSPRDRRVKISALVIFDPCSQTSCIADSLIKKLYPPKVGKPEQLEIDGIGGPLREPIKCHSPIYAIQIKKVNGKWEDFFLNRIEHISRRFRCAEWKYEYPLKGFEEVKQAVEYSNEIPEIMIGTREFWKHFISKTEVVPDLYVIQTDFGPVMGGEAELTGEPITPKVFSMMTIKQEAQKQMPKANSRLQENPELLKKYSENFEDQLKKSIIEKAGRKEDSEETEQAVQQEENIQDKPDEEKESEGQKEIPQIFTRRKAKELGININTLLAISLILSCFNVLPANPIPKCPSCTLLCSLWGLKVLSPPDIQKIEICCEHECWVKSKAISNFNYELPREILIQNHTCEAKFWASSERMFEQKIDCPAINNCHLFDCWFCWDLIENPECSPEIASIVYGIIILILIIGSIIIHCILKQIRFCYKLTKFISKCVLFPFKWILKKEIKGMNIRNHIRMNINKVKRKIKRSNIRQKLSTALLFVCLLSLFVQPSSQTISMTTSSKNCIDSGQAIKCTISQSTRLNLLPIGQLNTLLIKDERNEALGALYFKLERLSFNCVQKTDAWMRSYSIEPILASKKCPNEDSCQDNFCQKLSPESKIKEFEKANMFPGISRCIFTAGTLFHGCFDPKCLFWFIQRCTGLDRGCLFYRYYAKPTSNTVYEMFHCLVWEYLIHIKTYIGINGQQIEQPKWQDFILRPGITQKWGKISITALSISPPPAPILHAKFITNGHSVAIFNSFVDLFCEDKSKAENFNCSLSEKACNNCFPEHDKGSVECNCRDQNLEKLMEISENRLPLTIAHFTFKNERNNIWAEHHYSPIEVNLNFENYSLWTKIEKTKCWISPKNLNGCYKCDTEATFLFSCHTTWGNALAEINCDNNISFAISCNQSPVEREEKIRFTKAEINSLCNVSCPGGDTQFKMDGKLIYIPQKRRIEYAEKASEILENKNENWWKLSFKDISNWIEVGLNFLSNLTHLIPLLLTILFGILLLYLFILLAPIFRIWRTTVRLLLPAIIITVAGGGSCGRLSPTPENKNLFICHHPWPKGVSHAQKWDIKAAGNDYPAPFGTDQLKRKKAFKVFQKLINKPNKPKVQMVKRQYKIGDCRPSNEELPENGTWQQLPNLNWQKTAESRNLILKGISSKYMNKPGGFGFGRNRQQTPKTKEKPPSPFGNAGFNSSPEKKQPKSLGKKWEEMGLLEKPMSSQKAEFVLNNPFYETESEGEEEEYIMPLNDEKEKNVEKEKEPKEELKPIMTLLEYAQKTYGSDWSEGECKKIALMDDMEKFSDKGIRLFTNHLSQPKEIDPKGGKFTRKSATNKWIMPYFSVDEFFSKGNLILHAPNEACFKLQGGLRGTSRKSQKLQIQTHRTPWKFLKPHAIYYPPELLDLIQDGQFPRTGSFQNPLQKKRKNPLPLSPIPAKIPPMTNQGEEEESCRPQKEAEKKEKLPKKGAKAEEDKEPEEGAGNATATYLSLKAPRVQQLGNGIWKIVIFLAIVQGVGGHALFPPIKTLPPSAMKSFRFTPQIFSRQPILFTRNQINPFFQPLTKQFNHFFHFLPFNSSFIMAMPKDPQQWEKMKKAAEEKDVNPAKRTKKTVRCSKCLKMGMPMKAIGQITKSKNCPCLRASDLAKAQSRKGRGSERKLKKPTPEKSQLKKAKIASNKQNF